MYCCCLVSWQPRRRLWPSCCCHRAVQRALRFRCRNSNGELASLLRQGGNVWEKAGVNISVVYGSMPPEAYRAATGVKSEVKKAVRAEHMPQMLGRCMYLRLPGKAARGALLACKPLVRCCLTHLNAIRKLSICTMCPRAQSDVVVLMLIMSITLPRSRATRSRSSRRASAA